MSKHLQVSLMEFIDSHAHFDLCIEEGIEENTLLEGMREGGVSRAVQVSIDSPGFEWSYNFSKKHGDHGVLFTLGIHPSSMAGEREMEGLDGMVSRVIGAGDRTRLFGIGEAGLDYYRMRQPKNEQIRSFEFQAGLAKKHGIPLIVHSRDAMNETISILKKTAPPAGVMHCFSGNGDDAKKVLDLGFQISFAGNLTYRNAHELHDAARFVPVDRVLFETDAPFLTPVPFRGKKNVPGYVVHVYKFFAELRKISVETLAGKVHDTFTALAGGR